MSTPVKYRVSLGSEFFEIGAQDTVNVDLSKYPQHIFAYRVYNLAINTPGFDITLIINRTLNLVLKETTGGEDPRACIKFYSDPSLFYKREDVLQLINPGTNTCSACLVYEYLEEI